MQKIAGPNPLIAELDSLIALIEAQIPANPRDPKNLKLADSFEREMRAYFKSLSDAFPYKKLDTLYNRYQESLGSETDNMLNPMLRVVTDAIISKLSGRLSMIYIVGSAQMMEWGGVPYEGPPTKQAVEFASKRAGQLIKTMNQETKSRLAQVISNGIKRKRGIPGLTSDLRKEFTDMSRYRAQVIARNETSTALGQAFVDRGRDLEIEAKEWVTAGDDRVSDLCRSNEAAGVIEFEKPFPSGHMTVPGHVQCRCACAPARLK